MKKLILLLFLAVACDNDSSNPLNDALINTTWLFDKIEISNSDNEVIRTIFPDPDGDGCKMTLHFASNRLIAYQSECYQSGCGQWSVTKNMLKFTLGFNSIIPNYCDNENFVNLSVGDGSIELIDNTLAIDGLSGAIDQKYYVSDWDDIVEKVLANDLKIKSNFVKTSNGDDLIFACCAKLN